MASDAILRTYGDSAAKEDVVLNAIEILTARETQIFNMLPKSTAINTIHSYLTDTLATAASLAVAEGADYTASTEEYLFCDATSGAITITLPAVSAGLQYTIKKTDSSANAVTIDGNSAEVIDGELTQVLTTQWDVITIVSNGTAWFTI